MSPRTRRPLRTLLAGAFAPAVLVTALVASTAGSAQATDPYTPGGGPDLNLMSSSSIQFTVSPSGAQFNCSTFNLAGIVENPGTPRTHSARAGFMNSLTASGCTNPLILQGTWEIYVTGDPASATPTVWPTRLANVEVNVDLFTGACNFSFTGSIDGTFDTATQVFTPTSSALVTDNVVGVGCNTLDIIDGDAVDITDGDWTNAPPAGSGPLTLTH